MQAKYHAGKTLAKALGNGVELLAQAVAYRVHTDPGNGRVTHIEFRRYHDQSSAEYVTGTARGRVYVLAAIAIENARLMLASGLRSSSGRVGRTLMDPAYLLNWAQLPQIAGTGRGTNSTGGITDLRGGAFRSRHAGFAVDIHNDGSASANVFINAAIRSQARNPPTPTNTSVVPTGTPVPLAPAAQPNSSPTPAGVPLSSK